MCARPWHERNYADVLHICLWQMWVHDESGGDCKMKNDNRAGFFTLRRSVTLLMLFAAVVALLLALKKPHSTAEPQTSAAIAANVESFQSKVEQLANPQAQGQDGAEVRLTGDEVAAALAQANVPQTVNGGAVQPAASVTPSGASSSAATETIDPATLRDPVVTFEGDVVRGQFTTEVSGKTVYVTVAGHIGAKDGYATFDPTEFKIGDLSVPVALVNPALQKKLLEQRDRMKLPDFVSDLRVENGELVVKKK